MSNFLDDWIRSYSLANESINSDGVQYSIVYSLQYDIKFFGLQKLHPFDTEKWGKVARYLSESLSTEKNIFIHFFEPNHPITDTELMIVHNEKFVRNLNESHRFIVLTSEICLFYLIPFVWIKTYLLRPIRFQTTGTILASLLALRFNYGINLGGGFHHCSSSRAGGFCFMADISLVIRTLWRLADHNGQRRYSILIVDCDAHQGNGYCRDVLMMAKEEKKLVYIMDMYNPRIYPRDEAVKIVVNREILLRPRIENKEYLQLLEYHLNAVKEVDHFDADYIIFNAGTDILVGDRLGRLRITPDGVIKRDEIVFNFAHRHNIPILMLLSGGYQRDNAQVITRSLLNLIDCQLIKPVSLGN